MILAMGALVAAACADHPDDLGRVVSSPARVALQGNRTGWWRRMTLSPQVLSTGMLSPVGTLVHGAGTLQHKAVHRDILTGAHHKEIALFHLCNAVTSFPLPQQGGGLGASFIRRLERVGGLARPGRASSINLPTVIRAVHGGRFKAELHHVA